MSNSLLTKFIFQLNLIFFITVFSCFLFAEEISISSLPTNGKLISGSAEIKSNLGKMEITQNSEKTIIGWDTFNVGSKAHVNFSQPSSKSVSLNKVSSADPSRIYGQLTSNGQVFLQSPGGVIFGKDAKVDVGGLVASTMNINNEDLNSQSIKFSANTKGEIVNKGKIKGDYVALMATDVKNDGTIEARLGSVALVSGDNAELSFGEGGTLSVSVRASNLENTIENTGGIYAENGSVILKAAAVQDLVEQTIASPAPAKKLVSENGVIRLIGNSGKIESRIVSIDAGDNGGVQLAGEITAKSKTDKKALIAITGKEVVIEGNAKLTAKTDTSGGKILIGGDWQGKDGTRQAVYTSVKKGALVDASAEQVGNGGTVVVWSDIKNPNSKTLAQGTLLAKGGSISGDGGKIETSGYQLITKGIKTSVKSMNGKSGEWLLDPFNIVIGSSATGTAFNDNDPGDDTYTSNATSEVLASDINTALANGDVTIQTGGSAGDGNGDGDIIVNAAIAKSSGSDSTLTLKAHNDVTVNSTISSSNNDLDLVFWSDSDANGSGGVNLNNDLSTNGGYVWMGGGSGSTTWQGLTVGNANSEDINLAANVTTGQAWQKYNGPVVITGGDRTLTTNTNQRVNFSSTINSDGTARGLTINTSTGSSGQVNLNAAVGGTNPLSSLTVTTGALTSDAIKLNGALTVNNSTTSTISGAITDGASAANLVKAQNGILTISGNNTFTGSTAVNAGTLKIVNDDPTAYLAATSGITGSGSLTIESAGSDFSSAISTTKITGTFTDLTIGKSGNTQTINLSNDIATTSDQRYNGPVILSGGNRTLTAGTSSDNIFFESTVDSDGTARSLTVSAGTNSGGVITFTGAVGGNSELSGLTSDSNLFKAGSNITLAGLLDVDIYGNSQSSNYGIAGGILDGTSPASFSKGGRANRWLEVYGNNNYTGATTIKAGYLRITNDSPQSFLNNTTFTGPGHLQIRPNSTNFSSVLSMSDINFTGTSINNLYLGRTGTATKLVLDEDIDVNGEIHLYMPVELNGGDRDIKTTNSNVRFYQTVNSDGTQRALTVTNGTGDTTFSGAIGGSAPVKSLTITSDQLTAGAITLNGALTATLGGSSSITGVIANGASTANLVKAGSGTLTLSGANTYTGTTTINAGDLTVSGSLHDSTAVTIASGADYNVNASDTVASIEGAGNIVIASSQTLTAGDGNDKTLSGVISGAGNYIKAGSGTQTLSGANTYTGTTTINAGDLTVSGSLHDSTAVTIASGADYNVNASDTVASIEGAGNIVIASSQTLTAGDGNDKTLSGVISGAGNYIKAGSGTQTLTGNNSYTGSTTISNSSGLLKIERDAPLSYLAATSGFTGPGSLHVLPVSSDFSEAVSTADITLSGTFLNELVVGKTSGSSVFYIDSDIRTSGSQTYNAPTIVRNGNWELQTTNSNILFEDTLNSDGTPRNLSINTGSANLTLSGAVGGSSPLNDLTITTNVLTAGNIKVNNNLSVTNSGTSTISGVISNGASTASFIKAGTGLLNLTGLSTYTGSTTISAGTLKIINDNPTSYLAATSGFTGPGNLTIESSGDDFTADIVTGTHVQLAGTALGNLIIGKTGNTRQIDLSSDITTTGTQTYNGPVRLVGGDRTVSTTNSNVIFASTVNSDGTQRALTVTNGTGDTTFSGAIGGSAPVKSLTITSDQLTAGAITLNGALTATLGGSSSITGVIANGASTANLVKAGSGTLTLSASNTYTGTTQVSAGTLTVSGSGRLSDSTAVTVDSGAVYNVAVSDTVASIAGAGSITLGSNTLTSGGSDASTTFSGVISGTNGNIIKAGTGTLTLSGANTYTGTTTINAGDLTVSGSLHDSTAVTIASGADYNVNASDTVASIEGAGNIVIASSQTLTAGDGNDKTLSGVISGAGNYIKAGSGTQTLTGNNSYTGSTTISAGLLKIIRDDPTSYLAATSGFTGPGNLTIESSGDDFTADIVTGTHVQLAGTALGNLIIGKTGNTRQIDLSSDITTTGTQTYNGPVRLVGGDRTVSTTNSNVIFASTVNSDGTQRALTVTNGTGDTTFSGAIGGSAPVKSLTITSDQLTAGAITLNGALTATLGGSSSITGVIANGASTANLVKAGSGTLTLSASNTYTGTTQVSAGTLTVSGSGRLSDSTAVTVDSGAVYNVAVSDTVASIAGAGSITLGSNTLTSGGSDASTTFSGVISGTNGNIIKAGTGTLTLSGANTYTGTTTINAGDLTVSGSLHDSTAVTIASGADYNVNASDTVASIEGAGNIVIASSQTLTAGDGNDKTLSGVISGAGNYIKAGSGTQTLSASNTYTGTTQVSAGTLTVSGSGRLSDSTAVTVDSGAVYNVAVSDTVASIAGAGSITLGSNTLTSGGSDASTTFSGVISGTNGNIIKAGTGTLTLTGNNSYTGSTTISAGLLKIIRDDPTSYLAATSGFTGPGNLTIESSGDDFTADIVTGTHVQLAGTALGNLIIGKTGNTRQIDLSSDITTTGTQTYNGPVRLVGGDRTVSTTNSNVIFASTVNSDGTQRALTVTNGTGDTTFSGAIGGSAPVKSLTITSDQLTAGAITLNGALTATLGGSSSITGVIANGASTANLVKAGSGTLTLSASNTYTGTTQVSAGTLTVSGSGRLSDSTAVTVDSGAVYNVAVSDTVASIAGAGSITLGSNTLTSGGSDASTTFSGVISGTNGNIIKAGTGTLTLTGNNSYTGSTTISAGLLKIIRDDPTSYLAATSGFTGPGNLTIESSGDDFTADIVTGTHVQLAGTALGNLIIGKTGNTRQIDLSSDITTTGTQTYNGPVRLVGGDRTVSTTNSNVIFASTVNSDGTQRALTVTNGTGDTTFSGAIGGSAPVKSLTITSDQLTAGAITLNGALTATLGGSSSITGVIANGASTANLVKAGSGTLTLSASNTYTGTTQVSAGTLTVSGSGRLSDSTAVTVDSGAVYNVAVSDTVASIAGAGSITLGSNTLTSGGSDASTTFSGVISGTNGNIIKAGTGTLTLSGANTYTGTTTINAGDLTVSGSLHDSTAVTIASGADYNVNASDTVASIEGAGNIVIASSQTLTAGDGNDKTLSGVISGAGNYIKAGSGTQTLSASNTYTGTTQVSAGTLTVSGSGRLSDSTAVTVDSGAVYNVAVSDTVASIAGAGSITLGSNTLTSGGSDASTTFSGVISGTNGNIIKAGTGTLTLTGNNSYTGSTTISAGLLKIIRDDPTSYLAATSGFTGPGNLTIESSGDDFTADIVTGTHVQLAGTALGNLIIGKTGNTRQIDLSSDITTTGTQTYNGPVRLVGGDRTVSTTNSNVIFASTVNSDGTQRALTVTNGTGDTTFSGAIGGSAPVKSLTITSDQLTAGAITLNGALTATLGGSSSITGVIANGASTANLVKAGSGTLTLSGANTYTGTTTINAGDLTVSGSLHDSTAVTIASGADYNVNASDTVASIEGAGNIVIASSQTLTAGDGNDKTLSGVISGAGNYIKAGSGTQTLTGNNSYTGSTTISAGLLKIIRDDPTSYLAATSGFTGPGRNLTIESSGDDFTADIVTGTHVQLAGTALGNLIIGKTGNTRQIDLSSDITTTGTQTYNGPVRLVGGDRTVSTTNSNVIFASTVNSDGTQRALTVTNGTGDTTFSGAIGGSAPVKSLTITSDQLTAGAITLNGALTATLGGSSSITGVIANGASTANLVKAGSGTLTLSASNTYTGTTQVSAGTLTVSGSGRLSDSTAVTVDSGAVYNVAVSDTVASIAGAGSITLGSNTLTSGGSDASTTFSGVISGTNGNIIKAGTGTLTLSGANTYTGTTTINAGDLTVSGSLHDSTAVTIASGADYNVNASDTVASIEGAGNIVIASSQTLTAGDGNDKTLSGVISGAGNYIKAGSGTQTLSASNTYTGTTQVSAGTLTVSGSGRLSDSTAVTVDSGAVYNVAVSDTVASIAGAGSITLGSNTLTSGGSDASTTFSGVISGTNGNIIKAGTGTLTLTGNNSYTGSTTISAGLLKIIRDDPTSYLAATSGFTGPGNLTIESSGDDFTADIVTGTHVQLAGTALGNLIIGKTGNTRQIDLSSDITTTGTQTYNGPVRLVGGDRTVSTTNSNVIFASTVNSDGTQRALTVTNGTGDTTFSGAIGGSAPVKSLTITSDQLTAGAITLNGALTATLGGSSSITGVIANGASTANLVKAGSGTLTLSASNTYTGTTQVSAGTLTVSGSGRLSDSTAVTVDSGAVYNVAVSDTVASIAGAGSITLGSNTLTSGGSDASTTFSGVISGTNGNIIKAGTGTLTLSGCQYVHWYHDD